MKDVSKLAEVMRKDWDRRIKHDFRFWMSDGYESDELMWQSGARDLEILLKHVPSTQCMSYVEVGCGVGRMLKAACERFQRVIGVDISSEAIEKARELVGNAQNLELIVGNGLDLSQIPDQSIDCVGVYAALCSVPTEVFARYLIEINRILRPEGYLRMQVYLGKEQSVGREDTLHLRCYTEANFRHAMEQAGFLVENIEELKLPLEVSFESLDIAAMITHLRKGENARTSFESIAATLLPNGEDEGKSLDTDIEYWMSVNLAKSLVDAGDYERAKKALEYATSFNKVASIDVSDLLGRIVSEISKHEGMHMTPQESSHLYDANMVVLQKKFPRVFEKVRNHHAVGVEVKATNDGPVCWFKGQALDHAEKPYQAGETWAQRSTKEKRFADCEGVTIVGFGFGYHVDSMQRIGQKPVAVVEPSLDVFCAALRARDLTGILDRLQALYVGEITSQDTFSETSELYIRPQSLVIYGEELPAIKERFYGLRGLKALHPTVMVLGPLQGGTLPILGYTTRALSSLNQRVRECDMSPFATGYHALNSMLKEPQRQQAMHGNFLEFLSQGVFESAIEKKVDILICMAQAPITGRVLNELRARGVVTVLWFMEDYLRFTYWKEMAKFYDFVFTIQNGECLNLIKSAGAGEVHYIPAGCDPIIHTPLSLTPEDKQEWGSPISFVGAGYHNRQQVFASFAEMPFKLWGTEWPGCKPFDRMLQKGGKRLTPEEYIKIFNGTDININLHSSTERDGVDPYGDFVNPRTFELAAAGAFQLVDERSLLPELFEVGKEIITFSDPKDLKSKIAYYLERPEERKAIAARARERALREHTYGHRIKEMLSLIYSSKYEHLKNRMDTMPWKKMLERSERHEELHGYCKRAFERGEEPILDGLVADIMVGQGKLTETEQKLLFLHHVRSQIIRMRKEEAGG